MAVTPVPIIWLSSWSETNQSGVLVERGVSFAWELPTGQQAVAVQIDNSDWLFYNGQFATINIPYPNIVRILTKDAVKVRFRFKGKRKKVVYEVLPIIDPIILVLDDIILTRANHSGSSLCTNYPTGVAASLSPGGFREITYSDKYPNGKYRAVRIIVTSPGRSVASCVIIPSDGGGLNPNAKRTHEMMGMEACPQNLNGSFIEQVDSNNNQTYYHLSIDNNDIQVRAFRDPDQDQMIIRVFCPQDYTVTANLHG